LLLGGFLETLLFEVAPHDSTSVIDAGAAAAAIALLSSFVTARSAARIDPWSPCATESSYLTQGSRGSRRRSGTS